MQGFHGCKFTLTVFLCMQLIIYHQPLQLNIVPVQLIFLMSTTIPPGKHRWGGGGGGGLGGGDVHIFDLLSLKKTY